MGHSDIIFESILKSNVSGEDDQSYLVRIAAEYPYFSPAQFYLLKQMPVHAPGYDMQAAKTSVLFNNQHWLHFQLQEGLDTAPVQEPVLPPEQFAALEESAFLQHGLPRFGKEPGDTPSLYPAEYKTFEEIEHRKHLDENEADSGPRENEAVAKADARDTTIQELTADEHSDLARVDEQPTELNNDYQPGAVIDSLPNLPGNSAINDATDSSMSPGVETDNAGSETPDENQGNVPADAQPDSADAHFSSADSNSHDADDTDEPRNENEQSGNSASGGEPLNIKLNFVPANATEETIAFEPLHTTDYFASQGIRLSGEVKPNDKLGKQLKSFTEWLKTMKKVHNDPAEESGAQTDLSIQKLAERSNSEDEVVTEAMAEVLIRQGKSGKAAEVYKKLSLLNPSKNAYFAAKIDQLKEQ